MANLKQKEDVIKGTKKHIIQIARQLFSDYSYLGVSMSDIAKKLNITKAALYYHFTGKVEIYKKVLNEVFDNLILSIMDAYNKKTTDKKLHKLIKNYLDFGFKEKNLIKALMFKLSPTDSQIKKYIIQLREQVAGLIQPLIKEMIANKKLTHKVDSRLTTSLLTGMMDGLLLEYSFLNKKIDSKKVSDQIIAMLF
ncbi:MAG: TetR family transcriptional regulator [Xanthomonadaceae bacterium]|nr:TetR family transcriptional regulator [Rhodospirillaceae bacterium]NIA17752.1 TetR family transcriptional regulator [Xanthomonadaceae bacterium]